MKVLSLLIASLCAMTNAAAQPDLVILVRHAERAAEPAADPGLTPAGEQRAQALAKALGPAQVRAIVTTQLRRTRDTAAPLAAALGLEPQVIATQSDLTTHVKAVADAVRKKSGTVLVVGHSNTVPAVIAALGGPQLQDLCETSFSHIFVLKPRVKTNPAALLQLSYGEPSAAPAPGCL